MFDPNHVLASLTLEEKASLCSGQDFWHLRGIPRLNVPSIMLTDGPHGLRKQVAKPDHVGISDSQPATCFPPAVTLASTWNPELAYEVGQAIAKEAIDQGISVVLGPGANIKRHPYCGRNFEYFSEDPYLTSSMASAWIKGLQDQGVGASLKHYAMNNQESNRMVVDAVVDENAMHNLYLKGFKHTIQSSHPWTIMTSYNKVNGHYMSQHPTLLNGLLRERWQYQGAIITDWGANDDRLQGLTHGQDVEMPGGYDHQVNVIVDAIHQGTMSMDTLDERVLTILKLIHQASKTLNQPQPPLNLDDHHTLARRVAAEGMVLLKNEDHVLPLKKDMKIAIIGEMAKKPRYQGSGSSLINPHRVVSLLEACEQAGINYTYSSGYPHQSDELDPQLIADALKCIQGSDVVVVMVGLPDRYESEGFDRTHLNLPINHIQLIEACCQHHDKVVVVLSNGAPVVMPWMNQPQAILEAYLGGEASGEALVDVLFGAVSPSGKLAESFVSDVSHHLSHHHFPGQHKQVQYRESVYVGYRWLSTSKIQPLFPFGYGLSYAHFMIFNESVKQMKDDIIIQGMIHNQSSYDGAETIQVYAHYPCSKVIRPFLTLLGFKKIHLKAHESQPFTIVIPVSECAIVQENQLKIEAGPVMIHVGTSSQDFFLKSTLMIESKDQVKDESYLPYFNPRSDFNPSLNDFESLLQRKVPESTPLHPYTLNSTLQDCAHHPLGKALLWVVLKLSKSMSQGVADEFNQAMIDHMILEMPLRSLINFSSGKLSKKSVLKLLRIMNEGWIKAFFSRSSS